MKVSLKYGEKQLQIDVPDHTEILSPKTEFPGVDDPFGEVRRALDNPIASPTLTQIVENMKPRKIAILVSDLTRPSPSHIIVPPILDELSRAGVKREQIKIVFALGFHRKMSEEEMKKAVGEEAFEHYDCINHDINECVYIGETSRGTPVDVFRLVAESDLIIATGNLELHWFVGYSGGYKALLPGVCSKRTIEKNHSLMLSEGAVAGNINSPVRLDIEEAGAMTNVKFIVNVVLNSKKEIVKAVAGHPITAHREGVKYIDAMYKVPIKKKYDVVIVSCGGFPKDINLYQAQKGLDNASHAVKDNGTIVLIAECREGFGERTFEEWMRKAKSPDEPLQWIRSNFVLGGHKAVGFCRVLKKTDIFLCSSMDENVVREIFMTPFSDPQRAVDAALEKHGKSASILFMPYANSTLPVLE
ncbi:transcriptional regulator [Pseudothermotoga hypogea DSM 11164 = NBRC 106472]|uniref:Transcriptional regulator n=1 Tax=Pseudothermotoga hypogea DSM 11164 = NBRC 106472 TaxID=1123384 RepID=A0A0X1KSA0_9THEM|nr:nickel-dependent lactate racemase [Pseudothermotoga hypogea]AJC74064.1 transcriptional regulator [Pseudothermotoga hypogea DSM 11164 = NBRC 106472]MBC7122270.1 nickel-dependent lactate racemase [Pseudothermotoga sp.]